MGSGEALPALPIVFSQADGTYLSDHATDSQGMLLTSTAPRQVTIFLPGEFPRDWVKDELRFWNEQYLLRAFLTFNREFEVLYSTAFLAARHIDARRATFPTAPWLAGGSVWMRRR